MFYRRSPFKPVFNSIKKPKLYLEAFQAYFSKLPVRIKVNWFHDDGMIVGQVKADDKEFMTQGTDAEDFIKNVNESILTVCDIPDDYFDIILAAGKFLPPQEEYEKMKTKEAGNIFFDLEKSKKKVELAVV